MLGQLLYEGPLNMGIDGGKWYREEQRGRKRYEAERARLALPQAIAPEPRRPKETSLFRMFGVWFLVLGLAYWGMKFYQQAKPAKPGLAGEWVIPRSHDGHFYVEGIVNGVKTTFLVDTGATLVGVSEAFAQKANLSGGRPTTFQTANGPAPGRVIPNVLVSIGSGYVSTSVGVGLNMNGEGAESLLGQSFLSHFDVTLKKDRMVLKAN